jgi:hypothetical protein
MLCGRFFAARSTASLIEFSIPISNAHIALPGIIPKPVTYYIKRIYPSSTQLFLTEHNVLNLYDDVATTKEAVKI